jgi:CBS domain-containing protein
MKVIADIMSTPTTVNKSDSLTHAMEIMEKRNVRRLLVVYDEDVVGVLTLRGIMKVFGSRKTAMVTASTLRVSTAMSEKIVKVHPDMVLQDALPLLYRSGALVVADSEIKGWVTPKEILKLNMPEKYAAQVMRDPITASPGERVVHIRRIMLEKDIGRLPVVENLQLVGIISEKDIVDAMKTYKELENWGRSNRIRSLLVGDIMKRDVVSVYDDSSLGEVVDVMVREDIGGTPVLNHSEELVGMISRRDIVKAMIS